MPRCGATFDENTVPPWTGGDFRGGLDAATDPPRRCTPPLRRKGFSEERASEATCTKRQADMLSTFESRAGLVIEVVEFCDNRFDELIEMYNDFEPKRAAQGLPPVGRERIVAWLRHLQKSGHNLLALWNGHIIGHSMLCPMDRQRA